MTPDIDVYEMYEEVKQELCRIDNMTPEQYEEVLKQVADDLGI